jgi:hypothetical protein
VNLRDLPIAFSENEIGVAFIPLSSCLKVELVLQLLLRSAEFATMMAQSISKCWSTSLRFLEPLPVWQ